MPDLLFGVLAILAGLLFCFRGYFAMRIILPVWGAFIGFGVGAGLVAAIGGEGFLVGALAWIVGIAVALLFGFLAYAYFAVSVLLGMASIGFLLGASLMVALGVEWTWLVALVGVILGILLAWLALAGNLPMMLLTFLTASAGASAIVAGIMLVVGTIETSDLDDRTIIDGIDGSPWWWLLYLGLTVAGILVQLRTLATVRHDLRESWAR